MPLKYPDDWKFGGFPYEIPSAAHLEFRTLVSTGIAEGTINQRK